LHPPEEGVDPIFFQGKIAVLKLDPEDAENLELAEEALKDFVDCDEGEKLYVSLKNDVLTVRKMKKGS
jgi:hypothetical protein